MFKFLDLFFIIFHSTLIIFNLFGWIWRRTRRLNLISLLLTGFFWFVVGLFFGIGYCPLTEWHWQVLDNLGETDLPNSYIQYLVLRISGVEISSVVVEILTVGLYFFALIFSFYFNFIRNKTNA